MIDDSKSTLMFKLFVLFSRYMLILHHLCVKIYYLNQEVNPMLHERIKQRREELGMSQDELAKLLGYKTRSTIAKIEKGVNDIPQNKIKLFADALKTTTSWLLDIEEWKPKLTSKDKKNITLFVDQVMSGKSDDALASYDGGEFDDFDEETKELLRIAIEEGARWMKLNDKEKFTPHKYKKEK